MRRLEWRLRLPGGQLLQVVRPEQQALPVVMDFAPFMGMGKQARITLWAEILAAEGLQRMLGGQCV